MWGLALGWGEGPPPHALSPSQPWKGLVPSGRCREGLQRPALSLHSWGCPKQNYTFNESSSEINW